MLQNKVPIVSPVVSTRGALTTFFFPGGFGEKKS